MRWLELGTIARGRVVNVGDWGGRYPRSVRPKRVLSGTVIGLSNIPDVIKIRTTEHEEVWIRRDSHR